MIKRAAEHKLKTLAKGFPVVALIGPRQSGKTTLAQKAFANKPYKKMVSALENGFDEVQRQVVDYF